MSGVGEEVLRRDMVRVARALHARGWVANHDGNLTALLDDGLLLCTPTAVSKGDVVSEWLIVVDGQNKVVQGSRRGFSELQLHRAAYAVRADIGVVIHAHPPTATGFAVAGVELGHPFMAEPVVSLGATIPTVPYYKPGDPALSEAIGRALGSADAVLLDRHGVLTVGGSFEQALLRMELVEHLARIALVAHQLGGVRPLPQPDIQALTAKGRPASDPAHGVAPAALASPSAVPEATALQASKGGPRPDVASMVSEALQKFR